MAAGPRSCGLSHDVEKTRRREASPKWQAGVVLTRPVDLDDADLAAVLIEGWGLSPVALEYLAVGFGSHHWRATAASTVWFVTVDDLVAKRGEPDEALAQVRERLMAALMTAAALHDAGYEFVVAPVRTNEGQVARHLGDRYVVAVYRWVHGQTCDYGNYADTSHRDAVVRNIATLHRSPVDCRRAALTETFAIDRRSDLFDACSQLDDRWEFGPFSELARQLLARHSDAVARAFARYDALVAVVGSRPQRNVLTHGEPHPANTITTEHGVVLIDWDTALIAPPERDLWDLVGQASSVAAQYESLTGVRVDHDAVTLYRLAWDLAETALYISDFCQPHERTNDTTEAWQNLQHHLAPTRW